MIIKVLEKNFMICYSFNDIDNQDSNIIKE